VTSAKIRTARPEEQTQVLGTIALAFNSDPMVRWFYPSPGDYLDYMPRLTMGFAAGAFRSGTVFVTDGLEGASLWLPPGVGPDIEALEKLFAETIRPEISAELEDFIGQFGRFHIEEPHWYLPVIGVEPLHHGQGLGAALLDHALAICDQDALPAYLESSNPRNISLYQRHGFERIGEIQAGSSPVVTPMLRAARR
jgi:ribosomal protein S18 acetylase RimI-like enzyme